MRKLWTYAQVGTKKSTLEPYHSVRTPLPHTFLSGFAADVIIVFKKRLYHRNTADGIYTPSGVDVFNGPRTRRRC